MGFWDVQHETSRLTEIRQRAFLGASKGTIPRNIASTAAKWLLITVLAALFLLLMMETLRNLWDKWGGTYPFFSSLAVGIVAIACWWLFGGLLWLSKPHSSSTAVATVAITSDAWRPLSEQQIANWVQTLKPYHIQEIDVFWSQEVEAKKLFLSLKSVGKQLGFEVITGIGKGNPGEIDIETSKDDPVGPVLLELFKKANYPAKLDQNRDETHKEVLISIGEKPDA